MRTHEKGTWNKYRITIVKTRVLRRNYSDNTKVYDAELNYDTMKNVKGTWPFLVQEAQSG